jgi:hypothetical protein
MHVVVQVAIPDALNSEEEELVRKWAQLMRETTDRRAPTR